jgi:hypothetical protein
MRACSLKRKPTSREQALLRRLQIFERRVVA